MSTIPVAPRWASSAYRSSLRHYTDVANQSVFRVSDGFRDRLIAAQGFVDDRRIRIDKQDIRLAGCVACRNVRSKRTKRIKSLERSGVAQKRLRFVFLEFL
jgi:hypothetical protein